MKDDKIFGLFVQINLFLIIYHNIIKRNKTHKNGEIIFFCHKKVHGTDLAGLTQAGGQFRW